MSAGKKYLTVALCIGGGGVMFGLPYYIRQHHQPLETKPTKLTGTQRQRGMYMNTGQDAGPDPDWDPVTRRWTGYDKQQQRKRSMNQSSSDASNSSSSQEA